MIKTSPNTVTVKLPRNMKIFPTFHTSMVKPRDMERAPGQEDEDLLANDGRIVVRTDNNEEIVKWEFKEILNYGQAENGRWIYEIEWKDGTRSWQPARDLEGCDDIIWKFHDEHPRLPGPPRWVKRRARKN